MWNEYPFEPCSDYCVMPCKSDKSFARFYLTHSLCLKHRSSLTTMGPWLYLSNRISTLPKVHKSPQILYFITLLHQKLRGDRRVKDFLVACQLVEYHGSFTLLIRVDVYMTNNPLECKSWLQTYNVDNKFSFGDKPIITCTEITKITFMTFILSNVWPVIDCKIYPQCAFFS